VGKEQGGTHCAQTTQVRCIYAQPTQAPARCLSHVHPVALSPPSAHEHIRRDCRRPAAIEPSAHRDRMHASAHRESMHASAHRESMHASMPGASSCAQQASLQLICAAGKLAGTMTLACTVSTTSKQRETANAERERFNSCASRRSESAFEPPADTPTIVLRMSCPSFSCRPLCSSSWKAACTSAGWLREHKHTRVPVCARRLMRLCSSSCSACRSCPSHLPSAPTHSNLVHVTTISRTHVY
jgi:hypothetical protein